MYLFKCESQEILKRPKQYVNLFALENYRTKSYIKGLNNLTIIQSFFLINNGMHLYYIVSDLIDESKFYQLGQGKG